MDAKFFDSLYEGDSANGVKLGMGLTNGDFWPRLDGCYTVYRGEGGVIDDGNICAVTETAADEITVNTQGKLPSSSIWHYVRAKVCGCGKESEFSPPCLVVIDAAGEWVGAIPNTPQNLTVENLAAAKLRLRWTYTRIEEAAAPTGFKVYMDLGAGFDFDSPVGDVSYNFGNEFSWTSDSLTHGQLYRFCVRSYNGDIFTLNTNYVAAEADSEGPAAITGLILTTEDA